MAIYFLKNNAFLLCQCSLLYTHHISYGFVPQEIGGDKTTKYISSWGRKSAKSKLIKYFFEVVKYFFLLFGGGRSTQLATKTLQKNSRNKPDVIIHSAEFFLGVINSVCIQYILTQETFFPRNPKFFFLSQTISHIDLNHSNVPVEHPRALVSLVPDPPA